MGDPEIPRDAANYGYIPLGLYYNHLSSSMLTQKSTLIYYKSQSPMVNWNIFSIETYTVLYSILLVVSLSSLS